jgi:hypothetical protein
MPYPDALTLVNARVEQLRRGGDPLLLLSKEMWDAFKLQSKKQPAKISETDEAIIYNGLEVRQSAAG